MNNIENEIHESNDQKKHEDDIYKKLCHFFERQLSLDEFNKMIVSWRSYLGGHNKKNKIDVADERGKLDAIINKLNKGINALKELREFNMNRFNSNIVLTNQNEEAIFLIQKEIEAAKATRFFLLKKNNIIVNSKRLEALAIIYLFIIAERVYGLKSDGVGRGHKSPVLEFARIITGPQYEQKVNACYSEYMKLYSFQLIINAEPGKQALS